MGNIPAFPADAVKDCAKETMTTFVPVYVKAFAIALIKEMKADREGASGPEYMLRTKPIPSEPLKLGWIEKLGAVKKNWKKRWLIACNEADSYAVYYYEKEREQPDRKAAKGEINLCGYRCERITDEDDQEEYGEFSLKLYPYWGGERRRTWYVRCEDADTLEAWEGVFKFICQRCPPPLTSDPVLRAAFENAYQRTRWALYVWGWYSWYQNEQQMLGQLVVDRCNADIMVPVYEKISGRFAYRIRRKIEEMLDSTVGAVVGAQWKAASKMIEEAKPKVKAEAEKNLGAILDKQVELQGKISDAISAKISPSIDKVVAPVLKPIIEALIAPLCKAEKKAIEIFTTRMTEIIEKKDDLRDSLNHFDRECRYYWGALYDAFKCIYALTRYDSKTSAGGIKLKIPIGDIIEMLGDVSMWRVEDHLENVIRNLTQNAIYTFKTDVEEHGAAVNTETLNNVLGKLVYDSKLRGREEMAALLFEVVDNRLKKDVMPTLETALSPIKELIPDAMKSLLDVDDMANKVIEDIVMNAIYGVIDPTHKDVFASLDALAPSGVPDSSAASAAAAANSKADKAAAATTTEESAEPKKVESAPVVDTADKNANKTENEVTDNGLAAKTPTNDPDGPASRPKAEVATA